MRRWLFLVLLGLVGCNSPDAPDFLKSTGGSRVERRALPGPVRQLICDDQMDVVLTTDTGQTVELEGGANVLPKIRTDYAAGDSSLHVYDGNTFNWVRDYGRAITVRIPAGRLRAYTHGGYGRLATSDTLRLPSLALHYYGTATGEMKLVADVLELDANGFGELTLAGRTRYTYLFTLKTALVQARGLRTRFADMALGSRRTAELSVADSVHANLFESGGGVVYGRPRVSTEGPGPGGLEVLP